MPVTISSKSFGPGVALLLLAASLGACENRHADAPAALDILIHGGEVFSGLPDDPIALADIGIKDGKIVFVGDNSKEQLSAARIVDASGLIVAPGFIDPHTHSLDELESDHSNANLNYLTQGVTTVFDGNDGDGPAEFCATIDDLRARQIGTNVALFVGHGSVREAVMGRENRAPTALEMRQMEDLVEAAMRCDSLGLSTGLYYVPGSYAQTDEVVNLAKIAADYGGVYDSHLRDESSYNIGVVAAVEEALLIGRQAELPVHISHIKALGVDVWGLSEKIIELIDAARASGQPVTANQYPWQASGTHLQDALLPREFLAGDDDEYLQRLADADQQAAVRPAIVENLRRRGGAESILIVDQEKLDISGMTLQEISQQTGKSPIDAAIDIMLGGSTRIASFNMNDADIRAFMRQHWVMTSSDGTDGHPRKYASFPKKYRDYVVTENVLSLEQFLYRSSGLTAATFGLHDRGRIAEGFIADVIAFDPQQFAPQATFARWDALSVGIEYSIIDGKLVIDKAQYTGALPGTVITLPPQE